MLACEGENAPSLLGSVGDNLIIGQQQSVN